MGGGVEVVESGEGFEDGVGLCEGFGDVMGREGELSGDIWGVGEWRAEMEIGWECERERMVVLWGIGSGEWGGVLVGGVEGIGVGWGGGGGGY